MKLDEVKAALAPFAQFAELFTHNILGVSYEEFYKKGLTVNGMDREFILRGSDFDRAKEAFDFLAGLEAKQEQKSDPDAEAKAKAAAEAEAAAAPTETKADAPAEADAPAKKGKK